MHARSTPLQVLAFFYLRNSKNTESALHLFIHISFSFSFFFYSRVAYCFVLLFYTFFISRHRLSSLDNCIQMRLKKIKQCSSKEGSVNGSQGKMSIWREEKRVSQVNQAIDASCPVRLSNFQCSGTHHHLPSFHKRQRQQQQISGPSFSGH